MGVPARNRDGDARNAGALFVDGAGVRAAAAWLAELVRDAQCVAGGGQVAQQARVRQGAGVCQVNGRAETQPGIVNGIFRIIPDGKVVGRG